jgi:Domain of unknown function (DUF4158)
LTKLVEHWALLDDERELVAGKRGPTRLGFALLLKFYARAGRFPRGPAELDDEAVAFVARQAGVPASDLGFYEWAGSTIEYHRAQVRRHLGFRECSAEDANKLTGWPTAGVCRAERRADRVREELVPGIVAGNRPAAFDLGQVDQRVGHSGLTQQRRCLGGDGGLPGADSAADDEHGDVRRGHAPMIARSRGRGRCSTASAPADLSPTGLATVTGKPHSPRSRWPRRPP